MHETIKNQMHVRKYKTFEEWYNYVLQYKLKRLIERGAENV